MKLMLICIPLLVLTACGGGGDEPVPLNPDSSTDNDSTNTTVQGMAAIEVDAAFDFKTEVVVNLAVAKNVVNKRAFINVCRHDAVVTNSQTCFVRAPLNSGGITTQFVLPHQAQMVKAEIWYYDTTLPPQVFSWQFDPEMDIQTWQIE